MIHLFPEGQPRSRRKPSPSRFLRWTSPFATAAENAAVFANTTPSFRSGTKPLIFSEMCHGCGGCAKVCPKKAIHEVDRYHQRKRTGGRGRLSLRSSRKRGHPGIAQKASLHFRGCVERSWHSCDGSAQASRRAHQSWKATTVAAGRRTFYAVVEPLQAISDKDIDE